MPMPVGALNVLRSHPQASDLYLVIQQPEQRTPGLYASWVDYDWSCQISVAPAGDPVVALTVNNGDVGPVNLLDGMTIFIGSVLGDWDKGIVRLRGDQVVTGATNTLDIAVSSDIAGVVEDDDYVVVLDEFRLWQRFGFIDIVGGNVLWYKDWDITWAAVGSALAAMPPVPIMGPHAVKFVEPGETVQFYFDWADSYATAPGQATTAWVSWGETDHIGGTWNSGIETPGWQNYTAISGLAGFRVVLEVDDGNGNATTLPFRRGVRYVFTLRRPGQRQAGDPWNAEPLTSFQIDNISGSFQTGYWRTRITVYEDEASRYMIIPGTLVVVFSEDRYAEHDPYLGPLAESIGPIYDRENILFVGRIAAGSVEYDSETQTASFDVVSLGEEMSSYENYPIVINDDALAADWIGTPTLTVDRAVRYYVAWHTTLSLIADVFQTGDTHGIKAQDFMEGDIYSTLNSFLWDRLFARLLVDRFGRCFCSIDLQMQAVGSGVTLWSLDAGDWLDKLAIQHYDTDRCNAAEAGGLRYLGGDITPYLSRAPGIYSKYRGRPKSSNALAITDQDELNTLSGRLLAYANLEYQIRLDLMGNWRIGDIVPQEYVVVDLDHVRGDIDNSRFIIREKSYNYNAVAGTIFASMLLEQESDGPAGQTVEIPAELPEVPVPPPGLPVNPGQPPDGGGWGGEDRGRRIISCNLGVFVTDNIGAVTPYWYAANVGIPAAYVRCWKVFRDPWHWWTSGGTERTLWGIFSAATLADARLYKHEDFPNGTWQMMFDVAVELPGSGPVITDALGTIETEDYIYLLAGRFNSGWCGYNFYMFRSIDGGLNWANLGQIGGNSAHCARDYTMGFVTWPYTQFKLAAAHHSARQIFYMSGRALANGPPIWKTVNEGAGWVNLGQDMALLTTACALSVPYVSPTWGDTDVIYWSPDVQGNSEAVQRSIDAGVSFSSVAYLTANDMQKAFAVSPTDREVLYSIRSDLWATGYLDISEDGGVTWVNLFNFPHRVDTVALFKFVGGAPENFLTYSLSGNAMILVNISGDVQDKTGNLLAVAPGLDRVTRIERDTMGAA